MAQHTPGSTAPAPDVAVGGEGERAPDGAIDLTLYSCVQDDCDCVPDRPTDFTAWHSLGALPPGEYSVHAGAASAPGCSDASKPR